MIRIFRVAFSLALILWGLLSLSVQAQESTINVLHVKGTVNPVEESQEKGALACLIMMDTPGGLESSMREIVQEILNARIPVIVYVAPQGARAASAGVFITLSAHIAAMAPNTVIGAAHPVALGTEGEQTISEEMAQKIVNDAAAYIRSIATSRGRNADWAEKAVRESVSVTETEALQMNVIDIVASNEEDLLRQINGKVVTLNNGNRVTINTGQAALLDLDMNWVESFLYMIADPNIAYLLLSLGSLGIIAEIFNPGLIFPGVIGGISLLLGLYALGMLSVNWTGVLLILLAFIFFIAEFFTPGFGLLFGGGLVSLIVGSLILFQGGSPLFQIDWWVIALVVIIIGGFVAFAVFKIVGTYRKQATTGKEELKGKTAVVRQPLDPEGIVFYEGELWTAISDAGRIEPGEEVMITGIKGLKLLVTKKEKEKKQ
ncbi:MAG: nodulation protein NfeD [Dehalococcoidales bacterium]|jgi:membrane-bound serine protease (ClpP class)|nr:nodulation protein NfeD [Dehalococcoidales bacterium]